MATTLLGRFFTPTVAAPEPPRPGIPPEPDRCETEPTGRRERALDRGEDVVLSTVAQKILHGWLQNRHQTLYPLTVNVGTLDATGRKLLAHLTAISVLAATDEYGDRIKPVQHWMVSVGGDAAMLAAFDTALLTPPALSSAIEAILQHRLGAYAYIFALKAIDPHQLAGAHFLDYLGERLALPTTVMRSATRRYSP